VPNLLAERAVRDRNWRIELKEVGFSLVAQSRMAEVVP
jgi:hypothetical protein